MVGEYKQYFVDDFMAGAFAVFEIIVN